MARAGRGGLLALCVALCAALSACMVQLAPPYDTGIVTSLGTANSDIQTLFADIGSGTTADTFSSRKPEYQKIVAELGAVEIQIRSRPMPDSKAITKAADALRRMNVGGVAVDPNFTVYPSARAVHDLQDTMEHMAAADEKTGLRGGLLAAFKNQAQTFLTQAITYENFLKR